MAALALGALGAGVGSFFGYASIGWSIGSALGNYLFAPDQPDVQGPRIQDRTISGSAYGQMIPKIYGTYRVAGEVIDSADQYKEYANKEEAGKGGGGGGSYTTYTYTATFALVLCEGEIFGIRRIWMDGKLVYTLKEDANAAEIAETGKMEVKGITLYTGSETQEASPVLEAIHGAGNVPAYRGTAYLVFNELDITKFGRIPQITVEVIADGTLAGSSEVFAREDISAGTVTLIGVDDGVLWMWCNRYGSGSGRTAQVFKKFSLADGSLLRSRPNMYNSGDIQMFSNSGTWVVYSGTSAPTKLSIGIGWAYEDFFGLSGAHVYGSYDIVSDSFVHSPSDKIRFWRDTYLWVRVTNTGKMYRYDLPPIELVLASGVPLMVVPSVEIDSTDYGIFNLPPPVFCIDDASGDVYASSGDPSAVSGEWTRYDADGNVIETRTGIAYGQYAAFSNGNLWVYGTVNSITGIHVYSWDSGDYLCYAGVPSSRDTDTFQGGSSDNYNHHFIAFGNIAFMAQARIVDMFTLTLTPTAVGLDEVVEDICTTVGMESAEIDVADLAADTVRGYMIANQSPARGALEQLSAAYFFDGRESDGVLEFIKRGDSPSVTIDDDDLGCYEGNDVQELADCVRIQEEELPKALTVVYSDVARDYQQGAQPSIRQSVLNGTESTITLPLALSSDEGKDIADTIMFSAWENRHKFTLKTWQKYQKLEPADVISSRGETLRIISRNEGVNGLIELECVRELPQIYAGHIGGGVESQTPEQSITIAGPTESYLLDIPPLRDADFNVYGFYWAADGLLSGWRGATLLEQDGSTFVSLASANSECTAGNCTTALGDFYGGNVFDELNIVRVQVTGTLESKTALEVLNGANAAAIKATNGWEIIQYRDATLVSTGIYDLSGLLRGRLGTEQRMSEHAIGDKFVKLTSGALRFIEQQASDISTAQLLGAVSHGNSTATLQPESFTYTGNNVRPFTPVHIGGGMPNLATGWTIKWIRRTRYDWQWNDSRDAGADEASYDFEVRIYDDPDTPATVVRTLTVSGASVGSDGYFSTTYSGANMTTDFGSVQRRIAVSMRQMGAYVDGDWSDIVTLSSRPSTITATALLHFVGTDGSTSITDEYGHPVTVVGNAQIDTAQADPFGDNDGVLLLDGTGDYLTMPETGLIPANTAQPMTVDCWVYLDSNPSGSGLICHGYSVHGGLLTYALGFCNGTAGSTTGSKPFFGYYDAGVGWRAAVSPDNIATGQWVHIEGGYTGGQFLIFVDGTLKDEYTGVIGSVAGEGEPIYIGRRWDTSGTPSPAGKLKEPRIVIGEIAHTTDFTPPTSQYTE